MSEVHEMFGVQVKWPEGSYWRHKYGGEWAFWTNQTGRPAIYTTLAPAKALATRLKGRFGHPRTATTPEVRVVDTGTDWGEVWP